MEQAKYDVFISYSRKDTSVADKIAKAFEVAGITYFIDRQGISGGMEFLAVLAKAIRESKVFLFLASKNSYESKFTQSEIVYAFNKKKKEDIIPYIIDGSSLPEELEFTFSAINWRQMGQHPIETVLVDDVLLKVGKIRKENRQEGADDVSDSDRSIWDEANRKLHLIKRDGYYGYVNYRGDLVIPCKWKRADEFSDGLAPVQKKNGKWGFIDMSGNVVINCIWKYADFFNEGMARVQDGLGKWGFVDKRGILLIPCQWKCAYEFVEDLAPVENENGYLGFIAKNGQLVIPCKWKSSTISYFSESLYPVEDLSGRWGFIDKAGQLVIPCQWHDAYTFEDGLAPVKDDNDRWGYIDKSGSLIVGCQFMEAGSFSDGCAWAQWESGTKGVIDKYGRVLFSYQWFNDPIFYENIAAVESSNGRWGYIDKMGHVVIPCQWKEVEPFNKGTAWVRIGGTWKLIDKRGVYIEKY